jgi:HTH-type transcriptional regulator/antitoxin HigA
MNEVKPIRTEAQHRAALREIEHLWDAAPRSAEHDRLEVLATLVEDYEQKHHAIYPPDPVEAIRFRMEQLGLDRKALEPAIGSRARVSEVLSRRRRLTLDMIRRLRVQLGIPADVLLGEPAEGAGGATGSQRARP